LKRKESGKKFNDFDAKKVCHSVLKPVVASELKFELEEYSIASTKFPKREHDQPSIPKMPQANEPYLLFYQLNDENHKKSELYHQIYKLLSFSISIIRFSF